MGNHVNFMLKSSHNVLEFLPSLRRRFSTEKSCHQRCKVFESSGQFTALLFDSSDALARSNFHSQFNRAVSCVVFCDERGWSWFDVIVWWKLRRTRSQIERFVSADVTVLTLFYAGCLNTLFYTGKGGHICPRFYLEPLALEQYFLHEGRLPSKVFKNLVSEVMTSLLGSMTSAYSISFCFEIFCNF